MWRDKEDSRQQPLDLDQSLLRPSDLQREVAHLKSYKILNQNIHKAQILVYKSQKSNDQRIYLNCHSFLVQPKLTLCAEIRAIIKSYQDKLYNIKKREEQIEKLKGSYWVTEKFNFKCSQQEICSKYCIYVRLYRLCIDVQNSRLRISLPCCLWRFLTWISTKLHRERMRGNGEREREG